MSIGVLATLLALKVPTAVFAQIGVLAALGGAIGSYISRRVAFTDLPQLVAAFHSFVGLAAVLSCVASFIIDAPTFAADVATTIHKTVIYFGTLIGAITFTGSLVAFAKLQVRSFT